MNAPRFTFRRAATTDLRTAYHWYEAERPGLGEEFLEAIGTAVARAAEAPERYPTAHRDVRRVLVHRFPYAVFYRVQPERIVVVGVFHLRRDPAAWHRRR